MNKNGSHYKHLLELNLAMLFISTSGALGRYVELPVVITIALRALLAFAILWGYCRIKGISFTVDAKDRIPILLIGLLMGLHWVLYFYALRFSNVAIGMLSLFTYPILTALLEPWMLNTKFQRIHLFLALLVLCGIYFLIPDFSIENTYTKAVALGVFSALCYALRNILLKSKVGAYNGSMLMTYQVGMVSIVLLPALFWAEQEAVYAQWPGLLALAFLTTAVGHTLFLNSFRHFSITTASIISSIQPVDGII
ncbi:MAG: DMT family transporter, partial [Flavobacteriaceae bacterium]